MPVGDDTDRPGSCHNAATASVQLPVRRGWCRWSDRRGRSQDRPRRCSALLLRAVIEAGCIPLSKRALRTRRRRQVESRTRHLLARHTVDRLGRVRERQRRERDQVAVDLERVQVDVLDGVAVLVVAGVELLAGGAAPDRLLLLGLDLLGSGEEAARGDAGQDERLVVAAAGELGVVVRLTDRGVVRLVEVLDRRRPRRDRAPPRAPGTWTRRRRRP